MWPRTLAALALVVVLVASVAAGPQRELPKVLFLTHSAGFEHDVIKRKEGEALAFAERRLVEAAAGRFAIHATKDCARVNAKDLKDYAAVVFYTTGELPMPKENVEALLAYVKNGGAFIGIHPATDTFYKVPAYGEMIGGTFDHHPWHQKVRVKVEGPQHPSTMHLPRTFEITDEIYQFRAWDRSKVQVLLSLDVESVDLNAKNVHRTDKDFALAWCKPYGKGRVFYTALGHRADVWEDERFLKHVLGGIRWALPQSPSMSAGGPSAGTGPGAAPPAAAPAADAPDVERFTPIFDTQHVEGWKRTGVGTVSVADGVATLAGGPTLWSHEQTHGNFMLAFEVRPKTKSASAQVSVGPLKTVGPSEDEGHRIEIGGAKPEADGWNAYEITCIGGHVTVRRNGSVLARPEGDRSRPWGVRFVNRAADPDHGIELRRVRVKALPESAEAYHVLFEGDPAGWKMCGPGSFDLTEDVLTSCGGMGMYWHERSFVDFILLLDWKVGRRQDNAGVFVRFPDPGDDPWVAVHKGYEIQICDAAPAKHRTGSIYSFEDATDVPTKPVGEWNHYEIHVIGQHYVVYVNGRKVCEFDGDRSIAGHIGMQNHDDQSCVSFKNIRVVSLKAK